jgi:DNA topoisomerase-2
VNPSFDSQTKETLTLKSSSFGSTCELSDKFLKEVIKTRVVEHVVNFAKTREDLKLMKNLNAGGKKANRLFGIPKLEDANKAGTRDSQDCTLILTEGDSAKSLAMAGIEVVGRDQFGVFPLKGKLLNVRDATNNQILGNEEIQNLFKIIGLQLGKVYSTNKELRYGSIMIMTDQDTDGSHIKGLIINFIHHFWPSLVKLNGFLKEFITPIIKATKGNSVKSFYTIPEYKAWVDSQGPSVKQWKIKYYKGLGTSTTKEAKEYFKAFDSSRITFDYQNKDDDECIDLVFNNKRAADRKKWLSDFDYRNALQDHNYQQIRYKDFINKEFILFSIANNERSIPSVCDGLKPSERKILFSCFKRKLKDEIKVAQLAGYVAEHSAYHHGEVSLCKTIVAMAQNFVGSNNINLLMPNGMFGTRNQGGDDSASSRYIFTCLNKVSRHLFNEYDDHLMSNIIEEGQKIEPNWYLPIIPMILVNGADGIGTGWSTCIPCFNPREIIKNLIQKMKGGSFFELKPWYKGFTGNIEKMENGGYYITGKYELNDDEKTIIITELPIKKWTKDYKNFLEKSMGIVTKSKKDKKDETKKKKKKKEEKEKEDEEAGKKIFVEDIKEYHKSNRVHFEVKLTPDVYDEIKDSEAKIIKKMKLSTTIQITNLVCFDHDKKLRRYLNVEEMLNEYYEIRLVHFEMRKEHMLRIIARDLEILDNKVRFILAVINEEIIIRKAKKKDLILILYREKFTPMSKLNDMQKKVTKDEEVEIEIKNNEDETEDGDENTVVPAKEYDYLLGLPLWSLTYERVQDLQNQKQIKEDELKKLKATPVIDLWISDLERFLEVLDEVETIEEEERRMDDENNKNEKGKKKKGKAKQKKDKKDKEKEEKIEEEKEKKTKKASLKGNEKTNTNNQTIDSIFNKNSQKEETKDPLKMSLEERLAKRSNYLFKK